MDDVEGQARNHAQEGAAQSNADNTSKANPANDGSRAGPQTAPDDPDECVSSNETHSTDDSVVPNSLPDIEPVITQLVSKVQGLESLFESKLRYDAQKDETINRLHSELQAHKADLMNKITSPLVNDFIGLFDDLDRRINHAESESDDPKRDILGPLREIQQHVLDILERYDVFDFRNDGPRFDRKTQELIKAVPTEDAEQTQMVVRSLRAGFRRDDRVIRQEGVEVYAFPSTPTEENKPVSNDGIKDRNDKSVNKED